MEFNGFVPGSDSDPVSHSRLLIPSLDLVAWLACRQPRPAEDGRDNRSRGHPPAVRTGGDGRLPASDSSRRQTRAAAYLAKLPPGISGQRGHDRTFHAACILIKGFGLSIDEAWPLLGEWNRACSPPWSQPELEHKLRSAAAAPDEQPRGYLAENDRADAPVRRRLRLPSRSSAVRPDPGGQDERLRKSDQTRHHSAHSRTREDGDPSSPGNREASDPGASALGMEANPHRLGALFLSQNFRFEGGVGLRFWREEFHHWDGAAYRRISMSEIRAQISRTMAREFSRLHNIERDRWNGNRDQEAGSAHPASRRPPRPISVTGRLVGDVLQAVAGIVLVQTADCQSQPAWLGPHSEPTVFLREMLGEDPVSWEGWPELASLTSQRTHPEWPAEEVLPTRNALVHLPSFLLGNAYSVPPCPQFFNAFALDYDFDPGAPEPVEWLRFLRQIWEEDAESIACLQEWFGYLLTADTRQQKILMMVGPKRSGRGSIARVLKALAGASNVVNPTLATLARPFGLSALIDKPIAIFPDARLSSRPDNAAIVECLLSISGEDDQTVERKHVSAWTGRLPTRFVLISNELPRLKDASGALSSRLIILRFTRSFYGHEDLDLYTRLKSELPGILLWGIAGWERLRSRGRFFQPRSARDLVAAMDELASPIAAFLVDHCILEQDGNVSVAVLYEAWRGWCREHGKDAISDEQSFGRDLHAAIPGLSKSRHRQGSLRVAHYNGVRLRTPLDLGEG